MQEIDVNELKKLVQQIVIDANKLKNKHTDQLNAPVNYVCIFSQSDEEYKNLINITHQLGTIIKNTKSGPLFHINPLSTISGDLLLLKIRNPDSTRPERGDADFTVKDYLKFKEKYLQQERFKLMSKPELEMIELMDEESNVRVYFSDHPLDQQLL